MDHLEKEIGRPSQNVINAITHSNEKNKFAEKKPCGCVNKCPHTISNSDGELVIVVTRDSFNITATLPYCIWGTLYLNTNYGIVLQPYLPVGMTVANATNANGNMVFTYTQGGKVDTITVSVPVIGLISYLEILSNLKTNYMTSCFMTFECNASIDAPLYDNTVIYGMQALGLFIQKVGASGDRNTQLIIPKTRRQINNSVINIIEIYLRKEPIKPDTVWIHSIPFVASLQPPLSAPPMEYNFTIYIADRVNMNAKISDAT